MAVVVAVAKRRAKNQPGGTFHVGDRVEIAPHFDLWMRGDRYGTVVKDSKLGVYVKMDKTGKRLRYGRDDLTLIERARNPRGRRRGRGRGRSSPVAELVGMLEAAGNSVTSRFGKLTTKRRKRRGAPARARRRRGTGRNPVAYSERKAWGAVAKIGKRVAGEDGAALATLAEYMLEQLGKGVHINPALAIFGANPPRVVGVLSNEVQAVFYRHVSDGKDYVHPFGKGVKVINKRDGSTVVRAAVSARSGVRATLLSNGSVLLRHPTKPLWRDF